MEKSKSIQPPRVEFLPFAVPDISNDEIDEVCDTLRSGWLTTGPKTKQFEGRFAESVGAKFAVALNSCTAALHLALEAVGVKQGDEVITSPYTFAATGEVIRYLGATPVFVDVEPSTLNMDPSLLETRITDKTKAIIPIHIAGLPSNIDSINQIAGDEIHVIEDAAHAFPSRSYGRPIGSLSTVSCFSFYATKTLTTGEGGMLCTDDERIAERCRIMSLHGITKDAWKRYSESGKWYYEISEAGYKYNMSDIAAAMGLVQLRRTQEMFDRRTEIANRYLAAFDGIDVFEMPADDPNHQHSWHLFMLRLNLNKIWISRAEFIKELHARRIGTSVHFIPLHIHPYYVREYHCEPSDFPVAFAEYEREISLPIYSRMSDDSIQDVIAAVLDVARSFSR